MGSLFSRTSNFSLPPYEYHGKIYPFPVAKPVDGDKKNGAYRNVDVLDKLWDCPIPGKPWVNTSLEVLKNSYLDHPENESLGQRIVNEDGTLGDYEFIKYKDLYPMVVQMGRSIRKLFPWLQRQDCAGFYGKNSRSIQLFSLAIQSQSMISVPIYDTLGKEAVRHIISHSEMSVIVVSEEKLPHMQEYLKEASTIRAIIIADMTNETEIKKAFREAARPEIQILTFDDLFCVSLEDPVVETEMDWAPTGDSIEYILYTSGTTGLPKGVVIKHASMLTTSASFIHDILKNDWIVSNLDGVYSFLPLAHGYETAVELALLIEGVRITYYSGSLRNLVDDMKYAKPSVFVAVPRVLQRIQQNILNEFRNHNWFVRKVIQWCLWRQTLACRKGRRIALYDYLVFNKVKSIFGGRLRCLASGAAPLSGELSEFLQVCCGVPILEGYGLTETGAACALTINNGNVVYYTVGAPLYGHEIRLESLPDMGYTTDDLPNPRGEIMVRGPSMFSGYFKDAELTRAALDADGWFHTGDIGQFNADGSLSVIDRKKSILKLSQGEYVATEAVEAIFSECNDISQIFVYGSSYENCLVAVAAPNPEVVIPLAKSFGIGVKDIGVDGWKDSLAEACLDKRVSDAVMNELNLYGRRMGLQSFELIHGLFLDGHIKEMNQIFTVENGVMTPTFKLKRHDCYEIYKDQINSLYSVIHEQGI